jgi:hypothetical protein
MPIMSSAERHKESCERLYPMVKACEYFAPNGLVRRKLRQLKDRYHEHFGKALPSQDMMSYYVLLKAFQAKVMESIDPRNRHPKNEPFKIYVYDKKNGKFDPPYKVLYPKRDYKYELYRDWRALKEAGFPKVLTYMDNIFAHDRAEKTTVSPEIRYR